MHYSLECSIALLGLTVCVLHTCEKDQQPAAYDECHLSSLDASTGLLPSKELAWDESLDVDLSCWVNRLLRFDYEMAHISMFRHYTATHLGSPHPQCYICKKRPPTNSNVVHWGEGIKCLALWWFHVDGSCSLPASIVCFCMVINWHA